MIDVLLPLCLLLSMIAILLFASILQVHIQLFLIFGISLSTFLARSVRKNKQNQSDRQIRLFNRKLDHLPDNFNTSIGHSR